MKFHRLLPLAAPLLIFLLDELYFFSPKLIYLAAVLINLLIFFLVWQLCRLSKADSRWWNYLILPALASTAVLTYSVLLSGKLLIQLMFIFNLVFLYVYFRRVYFYLLNPLAYNVFSLENLSLYTNWLTFFLWSAALYGMQSFLNSSVSLLALVMLGVAILLIYQIVWVNKIELKAGLFYILTSSLVLVELFWSISFLPFNYNIAGLCLAITYYVIVGLVKNHLLDKLEAKKVRLYLILGSASLFLVMFTARWM